jgi:hypothetical protein
MENDQYPNLAKELSIDQNLERQEAPQKEPFQFQGLELPAHLQESLDLYAREGRQTGDFLRACLANDLIGASFRADNYNMRILPVFGAYIAHHIPKQIRGSEEAIDKWIKYKRIEREKGKSE